MALLSHHHAQHHEPQSEHSRKPSYAHIYIFSAVAAVGGLLFGYDTGTIFGIGMLFLPEWPRWLASKGRWNEAGQTLERLDVARKDEDLSAMRKALKAGKHSSVSELFGNWLATLLVSISFLTLVNHTGKALTFWIYAIFAIIGLVFCWFLVPETKGKSLEQIEEYWEHWR